MKHKSIAQQQAMRERAMQQQGATVGPPAAPAVKQQPGKAPTQSKAAKSSFEAELASLHGLDMDTKLVRRRELVEQYRPQIQAWIQGGCQGEFAPFAWGLQWLFDLGDLEGYFAWLKIALAQGAKPQHSSKHTSFATCMVFDLLEWAEENQRQEQSSAPYLGRMIEIAEQHQWGGAGKKRQAQAYYLQFKDLDRAGDAAGAIQVGVKGFVLHDAAVKTRLLELVDAGCNSEQAKALREALAQAKKAKEWTIELQTALAELATKSK